MKKNLFPTILISVLLAFWGLVLFGYNYSQATVINKSSSNNSLKTGLVGWWTFDAVDMTAVTSTDKSGSGNHGTRTAVTPVLGKIGQAMSFNGTNSSINIGQAGQALTDNFVLSAWVKTTNVNNNGRILARRSGTVTFDFYIGTASLAFYDGVTTFTNGVRKVNDNKWHLVMVVINGANSQFYVDGIRDGTTFSPTLHTEVGNNTTIGSCCGGAGFINGPVDDVRIYNRVLSSAEIAQLYTMGGGKINKTDLIRAQLRSGLVGQWTFDGADVTANTTTDKSGNGNDGTRSATGTTPVVGKLGQAFKFSGDAARYVSVPSSASLNPSQALSVATWVKTTDGAGILVNKDDGGANRQFSLLSNGGVAFYVFQTAGIFTNTAVTSILDGKWHLVVGTVDVNSDGKARIYTDGVLRDTGSVAITSIGTTTLAATIGDRPTNAFPLSGTIDDVRIYNRALSPAEIMELYAMGGGKINKTDTTRPAIKNGLVGHWTFDGADVTASTVTDKSANGNNGTRNATGTAPIIGKIGQGMKFDGINGNVDIADQSYFSPPNNSMTITGWFKTTATSRGTIVGKSTASQYEWAVELNGNAANKLNWQLWQSSGAGYGVVDSVSIVNDGKWHYFAATINYGVRQELFLDGVLEATNASFVGSMTDLVANVKIGRRPDGFNSLNGSTDDIRIYNRVLSPAEIMQLYRGGK